jgi:hypothetical protein
MRYCDHTLVSKGADSVDRSVKPAKVGARVVLLIVCLLALVAVFGCTLKTSREGIPSQAQSTIDQVGEEIPAGRYDQIYDDSADEYKHANTHEQSGAVFKMVKAKLGNVKSRTLHSATERDSPGGEIPGHSLMISYQTTFDRGEGMETFTLLERDGKWLLAGYFVNSSGLK